MTWGLVVGTAASPVPWWLSALGAVVVFLVGGGTIGPYIARRWHAGQRADLVEVLSKTFATRTEVDGWRRGLSAEVADAKQAAELAQGAAKVAIQNADTALDIGRTMEIEQRHQRETLMREVMTPMREMAAEQRRMGETLSAQTALLRRLTDEFDRERQAAKS